MDMKKCYTCRKRKPLDQYEANKTKPDKKQGVCRDCRREYRKQWYQKNKKRHSANIRSNKRELKKSNRKKIFEYLKNHPCIDCGEKDYVVLEFDHVRGKKENVISEMTNVGYCWGRIENEIKKCDVRCANCHRRKTAKDFNWYK